MWRGAGFISQTTNQMHPTVYVVHIICLQSLNSHLPAIDTLSLPARSGHNTTKQQPNPPAVRFRESFSRIKGASDPSFGPSGGEKGGGREGRGSPVLVAFSWLWRGAAPSCPSQPGSRSWCWRQSSGSGTSHTAGNRGECPSAGWSLGSGRCDTSHIPLQGGGQLLVLQYTHKFL